MLHTDIKIVVLIHLHNGQLLYVRDSRCHRTLQDNCDTLFLQCRSLTCDDPYIATFVNELLILLLFFIIAMLCRALACHMATTSQQGQH